MGMPPRFAKSVACKKRRTEGEYRTQLIHQRESRVPGAVGMEEVFRLIRNKADPSDIKKSLKGKDLTTKDKSGQTILHYVCLEGYV